MNPFRHISYAFVLSVALFFPGCSAGVHAQDGDIRYGVVIAGIGGEPAYVEKNARWATGIYRALRDEQGFGKDRLFLFVENPGGDASLPARKSTLEEIGRVFDDLSRRATPSDALFIVFIGHGSNNENDPKLSLPGPDLSPAALRGFIATVQAGRIVIVHGGSASAPFIEPLSGPGRVIVTATKSGRERLATVFPEHFLAALSPANSDLDKDGRVSVLEAFTSTRLRTEAWYEGEGRLSTEHPLLDDNGDGVGSRDPGGADPDGTLARSILFGGKTTTAKTGPVSAEKQKQLTALEIQARDTQRQIDALKRDKNILAPDAYASQLQTLLVKLARINRDIKALQEK
ncbi:MAG: caspase family protein [candidate division Zixibacteria bacterium]|nr:caspase family protein [candidate division Zixibacteria bacterium]